MATLRQWKSVESAAVDLTVTLDAAPLVGSLLVAVGARGAADNGLTVACPGWVQGPNAGIHVDAVTHRGLTSAYRISAGNAAARFTWSQGGGSATGRITVYEFAGVWPAAAAALYASWASPNVFAKTIGLGPVAVPVGSSCAWVVAAGDQDYACVWTNNSGGAFTITQNGGTGAVISHCHGYRVDAAAPASRSIVLTNSNSADPHEKGAVLLAFLERPASAFPPHFW